VRKTIFLGALIFIIAGLGTSFSGNLITSNGTETDLFFDQTNNYSGFYDGFPGDFEQPENVGSFSFRDQSIVNEKLYLQLERIENNITGENIQLYYSSKNGSISEPLLTQSVYVDNYSGDSVVLDVDISAFDAVFPGKVYAGFPERETEPGATFTSSPGSENYTHTFSVKIDQETDGESLDGFRAEFDSSKVENLSQDDLESVTIEKDRDDVNALDDVSNLSITDEGKTVYIEFSGSYNIFAGDNVTVSYGSAKDAVAEEVSRADVNPSSKGSEYTYLSAPGETVVIDGPFNLTEVTGTVMDGNYTVTPSIRSVQGKTKINIDEVFDSEGNRIHDGRSISKPLIVGVERNEELLDAKKVKLGEEETFNFTFSGGEKVFINGILGLETRSVSGCETINEKDFYYLLNESSFNTDNGENGSCLEVSDVNNTIVDFANSTIDGDENSSMKNNSCALRIRNTDGITLKNPRVQQFARGICVEDSTNTLITGTSSKENRLGIYLNNSSAEIEDISLKNEDSEIDAVDNSVANMTDVDFETADISGVGHDVRMKNVLNPPPDPNGSVNMSQWINITKTDSSGKVEDIGFNYPPLSESDINPLFMYKFDLVDSTNGSREWTYENLSIVKRPSERIIMRQGEIDEFSVFGIYGEEIQGNGTGNSPGEGAGNNPDGTGNQGPGDAAGGGTTPRPQPEPEPTPIELNLSLTEESVSIQQGGTSGINFSIQNIGEVDSPSVYVESETQLGWQSGRQDFEEISEGEQVPGNILLDVYQDEVPGTYSVPVEVRSQSGSTLDTEFLEVEVLPRRELRDISVVEAPTFLNLESSDSRELGFLIENSGDYALENVTLEVRNAGNCIQSSEGSHNFEIGERKNVEYTLRTGSQEATCTGVFVFHSQNGENLGINPVRISVAEPTLIERLTTNVLPGLFLLWTLFTAYWVRRRFYER